MGCWCSTMSICSDVCHTRLTNANPKPTQRLTSRSRIDRGPFRLSLALSARCLPRYAECMVSASSPGGARGRRVSSLVDDVKPSKVICAGHTSSMASLHLTLCIVVVSCERAFSVFAHVGYVALRCGALPCGAVLAFCGGVVCVALLRCVALRCVALRCIALRCVAVR
jgi:hypothetical protein